MAEARALHLFEALGVELEYMIVAHDTLEVNPVTDELIKAAGGAYCNEIERGPVCWSNELALHVVELKTNGPAATLYPLEQLFSAGIHDMNTVLARWNSRLMPSAMHPFMDPLTQTRLWPHDYNPIYEAFNRIFSCKGHGWSNLQSMHVNLPFSGDNEFRQLHAAIRLVLPLIPALAASSPFMDGRRSGYHDTRMMVYGKNSALIPSISGDIVPESVSSEEEYRERILDPIYRDLRPHDPDGILQEEWVNARGAIARFERNAIEIRVIDTQECPAADLAVAAAVIALVRSLCDQRFSALERQLPIATEPLKRILYDTIRHGENAVIGDATYLQLFGLGRDPLTAAQVWSRLIPTLITDYPSLFPHHCAVALETILTSGSLASRILHDIGLDDDLTSIRRTYRALCDSLQHRLMFAGVAGGKGRGAPLVRLGTR